MTLTTMDPPVVAFVSVWTQQSYGAQVQAATALLRKECDDVAVYLVTESVPLPAPPTVPAERFRMPGVAAPAPLKLSVPPLTVVEPGL